MVVPNANTISYRCALFLIYLISFFVLQKFLGTRSTKIFDKLYPNGRFVLEIPNAGLVRITLEINELRTPNASKIIK